MESTTTPPAASARVLIPAAIGAAVALAIGVYANQHDPTGQSILGDGLFFSATLNMKAWLATIAILLAGFQLISALWLYERLPGTAPAPPWLGAAHKLSGTLVVVESKRLPGWALPVAGGTVFTTLVVIWLTSSLWFFDNFGFPAF